MEDKTPLTADGKRSLYDSASPQLSEAWKLLVAAQETAGWKDLHYMVLKLQQFNPGSYKLISAIGQQQTESLQERVKELEEDNKKLQEESNRWHQKYFKHVHYDHAHVQQLNEKLMGLLKKQIAVCSCAICRDRWQSFLKEHGLTEQPQI